MCMRERESERRREEEREVLGEGWDERDGVWGETSLPLGRGGSPSNYLG